jgi:fructose-bisphosphate aldolase class I
LSGGQSEEEATVNLNTLNQMAGEQLCPWRLSFSYGRALQASTIKTWAGKEENREAAQKVFEERCKANSEAQLGKYVPKEGVKSESLYQANYVY